MIRAMAAGGVVFRRREGEIEVLVIKDRYERLAFPKGYQEKGETMEQTALRETGEETNLEKLKIIREIGKSNFWFTRDGERIYKTVRYYLIESEDPLAEPRPQWEIKECFWLPLAELPKLQLSLIHI